jgi:hypothetical protein
VLLRCCLAVFPLLRLVSGSNWYRGFLKYVGGAAALFATPACYSYVSKLTLNWTSDSLPDYVGDRYVKNRGPEVDRIEREQVIAVVQSLDRARFSSLEDRAFRWCFVGISVSADGSTKRVVSDSYCDRAKAGTQSKFVQAAKEIDVILDTKRWVSCDGPCRVT